MEGAGDSAEASAALQKCVRENCQHFACPYSQNRKLARMYERPSLHWNSPILEQGILHKQIIWMFLCTLVLDLSLASFVFSFASVPQGLWCIDHDIYFGLRPLPSVPSIAYAPLKCKHGFWSDSNTS